MTLFSYLFGPKIEPETIVEIWKFILIKDDGKDIASLALSETSTWSHYKKHLLKVLDIPSGVYGLQDPMVVVFASYYGKMLVLLFTQAEFKEKLGAMRVHTLEEQKQFIQYLVAKSELAVLELDLRKLELEIQIGELHLDYLNEIKKVVESLKK